MFEKIDKYFESKNKAVWEFIKFNLVSFSGTLLLLILANVLPIFFDGITAKLPELLRPIFNPDNIFQTENEYKKYVVDGVVTWGYVLPFFLSNVITNIYSYFVNMKVTFKGKISRQAFTLFLVVLVILILFTTWLQGIIFGKLATTSIASLSRTIASLVSGTIQMIVIYPLEKYVFPKM